MPTQINRRQTVYGYPNPQAGLAQEPIISQRSPQPSDSAELGTVWVNTNTNIYYILTSSVNGVNVWSTDNGVGAVDFLTGNSGGAIAPTLGNINIVGTGGVTVTGNPGTSTLTIAASGGGTAASFAYTAVSTATYTALPTDTFLGVDTRTTAVTIYLPNAPTLSGKLYIIKDTWGNALTNNITITTPGGTTQIDTLTTQVITGDFGSLDVIGDTLGYEIW